MKWPALVGLVALTVGIAACGGDEEPEAGAPPTETPAAEQPAGAAVQQPAELAAPPSQPVAQRQAPLVDEPWTPEFTGTVSPGMTREGVVAAWGEPLVERWSGSRAYLHYRNGCEVSCGTFDVVFLEDGQVIDAIVRGAGHTYSGISSSPPDRVAEFTPPDSAGSAGVPE